MTPTASSRAGRCSAEDSVWPLSTPFIRARAAAPIRIGFPIPLTGPYQEEALDMLRGGRVAVAMFNEQGGLNGQLAELLMRDDELDPTKAVEVTRELIENDHVDFVTGGLSASMQLAINGVTKTANVLFNSISQSGCDRRGARLEPHHVP